jgi:large subunit ribosomal protein L19
MAATKPKRKVRSKGVQVPTRGLLERVGIIEKTTLRTDLPNFKAGDQVKVHTKIKEGEKERIQMYEGLVIAQSGRGASRSFTVRKMSHGVGVERIFLETSPKVAKVEIVQEGKVRRAKLYYIRELEGRAAKIDREKEAQVAEATAAAPAPSAPAKKN